MAAFLADDVLAELVAFFFFRLTGVAFFLTRFFRLTVANFDALRNDRPTGEL